MTEKGILYVQIGLIIIAGIFTFLDDQDIDNLKTKRRKLLKRTKYAVLTISICSTAFLAFMQYNFNEKKQKDDAKEISALSKELTELKRQAEINKDTILSNATNKALHASEELESKANYLSNAILGGKDHIFIWTYLRDGTGVVAAEIVNRTKNSQYDIFIIAVDYNSIEKCGINKLTHTIDGDCINNATKEYRLTGLYPGEKYRFPDLTFNYKGDTIKHRYHIVTRSLDYYEEILLYSGCQSFRIFEYSQKGKKIVKRIFSTRKDKIDWEKKFKISPFTPEHFIVK